MASLAVFRFWSEPGAALTADWPSGTITVEVPAYVVPFGPATTYKIWPRLYRGQSYSPHPEPWDTGTLYEAPEGLKQNLGASPSKYTFSVPVRSLSGQASDRLLLEVNVERDDANTGGEVHVFCDGADNQVRIVSPFVVTPAKLPSLKRNPDSARPGNVASATVTTTATLGTFTAEPGYPGLAIWPARVWRFRVWARVPAGGSVTLSGAVGRGSVGGVPTMLATTTVGVVESTDWALYRADVLVPESSGELDDVPVVSLGAAADESTEIQVGIGLDDPSSVNAPLVSPPGGTVTEPTDDHKVQVEAGGLIGYLSETVASPDASVLVSVSSVTGKLSLQTTGLGRGSDGVGIATLEDGIVTIPAPFRKARLVVSEDAEILGINPTSWPDGGEAVLYAYVAPYAKLTVRHQASGLADNARLRLAQASDSEYSAHVRLRCELDSAANGDHTWWVEDLVT